MSAAYVDTSCLAAMALREPGWRALQHALDSFDVVSSSELLVAEFHALAHRERLDPHALGLALDPVRVVIPDRSIRPEIERALAAGYLRGADLWHIACALYVAPSPASMAFLTRDGAQRGVAARLGFATP